ncbi:MAG: hypothetical protein HYX61_00695 [Gammaproteobacteria bacterium]|jgi:hypothetical protein|nr:hypothetical protein [Gammaproteobacteria bacterium]
MAILFTPSTERSSSLDKPKGEFADVLRLAPKAIHPLYDATNVVLSYNDPKLKLDVEATSRMRNR